MIPAHVVEIITPKKCILNGLWFGPKKPKCAIILVHGLTASAFSMGHVVQALTDSKTAVITFNNRGFKSVADIKQKKGAKSVWKLAGSAHEVFKECVDDIQGAVNLVKKVGVKKMYLAGHSTGCQKSMYWASKTDGKDVRGIILLAPISDWASEKHFDTKGRMAKATKLARVLVRKGKPHELMPKWASRFVLVDAQRYVDLYTPESPEEIFSYAQPHKKPKTYESVQLPVIVFLAGADEHADRPAKKMRFWFKKHSRSRRLQLHIVSNATHGFRKSERIVARLVRKWIAG